MSFDCWLNFLQFLYNCRTNWQRQFHLITWLFAKLKGLQNVLKITLFSHIFWHNFLTFFVMLRQGTISPFFCFSIWDRICQTRKGCGCSRGKCTHWQKGNPGFSPPPSPTGFVLLLDKQETARKSCSDPKSAFWIWRPVSDWLPSKDADVPLVML